jgi:hypothetical protein
VRARRATPAAMASADCLSTAGTARDHPPATSAFAILETLNFLNAAHPTAARAKDVSTERRIYGITAKLTRRGLHMRWMATS